MATDDAQTTDTQPVVTARTRGGWLTLWRASLTGDASGETDPYSAALKELAAYFDISVDEARQRCDHWREESAAAWDAQPRDTEASRLAFYRTDQNASWIFDTVAYQAKQARGELPPESVMIAERLRELGVAPGAHLDFGAGPGGTSLFFHRLGWQITLADISTTLLTFARWRLEHRGISARYLDTVRDELPAETYDLITACDVMVHVPDPATTMRDLHRALKPGGLLFFNVDARRDNSPAATGGGFLYTHAWPVLRPVRAAGFQRLPRLEFFHVYRKLPPDRDTLQRRRLVTALDLCRYNAAVSQVGDLVRAAKRLVRR